jgi:protein-S-isoprenylcysteine O-methyltransferase Ste14
MKHKLQSTNGLNAAGVGPKLFLFAMPGLLAGIILGIYGQSYSQWAKYTTPFLVYGGLVLLVIGIIVYVFALIQFLKQFRKGVLITTGVYAMSRNPIYASWILFILPGISLMCNNWAFFLAAVCMYIGLNILIEKEEKQLLQVFGQQYEHYKMNVGRVGFLSI